MRIGALAISAAVAAMGLAACGGSDSEGDKAAGAAADVTVLLDWFPNPDHISLYSAQKMGAFDEQGLKVKFQPPSNNTDSLKLVSLGQMPLAISYENAVINAETQGLDVVAVAALVPTALNSLILAKKDGVSEIADLKGKNIGTAGDPVAEAMWGYVLRQQGFSDKDIKFVTINQGFSPAMISGKVSAIIGAYQNIESVELEEHGVDPVAYSVTSQGIPNYDELVVIANRTKLKNDEGYRETVRKFLAGLAAGDQKAQADPAFAFEAMKPVAKGYSADSLKKMVDKTAPLLKNDESFGMMQATDWQALADWMFENKVIEKAVDASTLVDTTLLPGK